MLNQSKLELLNLVTQFTKCYPINHHPTDSRTKTHKHTSTHGYRIRQTAHDFCSIPHVANHGTFVIQIDKTDKANYE